jgi:hypothetical protein
MKNTTKWLAVIVLVAVTVFSFTVCNNGTTTPVKQPEPSQGEKITYKGGDYELSIIENTSRAAAYIPAAGDQYEIRDSSGKIVSKGSITKIDDDGTYTFKPASGKDEFTGSISSDKASFQITSTITLDDGTQLQGLSLSNSDNDSTVTVYNSYQAAAAAGYLYHNGTIDNSLNGKERLDKVAALMKTLNYTRIKINSNLPISTDFRFNFSAIVKELGLRSNDYYKWDIEYNDHRILAYFYLHEYDSTNTSYTYSYQLVNEVLLLPEIKGEDYSAGTIKNGVSNNDVYDNFYINAKAPVDNLGLLQLYRILQAVATARNYTFKVGDYINWEITYSDSVWRFAAFITNINPDGSIGFYNYSITKVSGIGGGQLGSLQLFTGTNNKMFSYSYSQ